MDLLIAAIAGGFIAIVGYAAWVKYQKDEKARALRTIVKTAERIKKMGADADEVEIAKREAEEEALLKLAADAVKGLK